MQVQVGPVFTKLFRPLLLHVKFSTTIIYLNIIAPVAKILTQKAVAMILNEKSEIEIEQTLARDV